MGYKRNKTIYTLDLSDTEDAGLTVKMTGLSIGKLLELDKVQQESSEGSNDETVRLLKEFADHLLFWDLEDDNGKPVPTTLKGVHSQDLDFILMLINKWLECLLGTPKELGKGSNSGETFPEALIPVTEL